jgi:tetratricopeptide (TPR) repeat protein/predicted Ser/Thr protein kinase
MTMADERPTEDMPPTTASSPPSRDTTTSQLPSAFGPYRILRVLGEGGMGVVYLAEQDKPRRRVALKVLKPGAATAEHLRRFEHEADVLGRLQHPNIAQIFEAGMADAGHGPQPFFAMELIAGQPLTVYARERNLGNRQRLAIMIDVCRAVQYAHTKGVIHRDLKPSNILVDEAGRPKVLDFGVARLTDGDVHATVLGTGVGQLVGTIPYMSPEQAAADPDALDTRSDVYTLGVICYQLLAGRLPHEVKGKAPLEAVRTIREDDPTPLSAANRAFRGDLETIVATALEKDPDRRYPSAAALADDIERYLTDQPIVARPAGTIYRLRKFTKRNKAVVGGVIAVFVVLLLGIAATSWWASAAVRAELELRESLAADFAKTGDLAAQRGRWREALELYDKALLADHADPVGVQLKKARALFASSQIAPFERVMKDLSGRADLGQHEGAVLLLRGGLILGKDNQAALDLIGQARRKGLGEADDLYAQALLAPTSPETVRLLEQCLDRDPSSWQAQWMQALTLLLLGRFTECRSRLAVAEALFPDDPNPLFFHAMLEALDGRPDTARAVLDRLPGRCPEHEIALLRQIVELLATVRDFGTLRADEFPDRVVKLLGDVSPRLQDVWKGQPASGDSFLRAALPLAATPPILRKTYAHVTAAIDLMGPSGDEQKALAELSQAVQMHPEGSLLYLLAIGHFNLGIAPGPMIEAEKAAMQAAAAPSLVPIRRGALFLAATCEGYLGAPNRPKPDLDMRRKAVVNLRAVLQLGPPQPNEFEIMTKIANMGDDLELTRGLLSGWEPIDPGNASVLKIRHDVEMKARNFGRAVEAAAEGMKRFPKDGAWQQRQQQALQKLRDQIKATGAP